MSHRDKQKITGGCQCGAVRYEAAGAPSIAVHCHCDDCRKSSGADHSTIAMFSADAVDITGNLNAYTCQADSRATVTRQFCPICGSTLFAQTTSVPGSISIMAGTIDAPAELSPQFAVYAKRRSSWDFMNPALPAFDLLPPHIA